MFEKPVWIVLAGQARFDDGARDEARPRPVIGIQVEPLTYASENGEQFAEWSLVSRNVALFAGCDGILIGH